MTPRPDVLALVVGILACALAALGLWGAFFPLSWPTLTVAAPVVLVLVGVVGLLASRPRHRP